MWLALALTGGMLVAVLPINYSAALLAGSMLFGLALWRPAIAVGCAVIFGPTRALLAAMGYAGLMYDLGQIFFAVSLCGWLAGGAARRTLTIPVVSAFLPLSAYIGIGLLSLLGTVAWQDGLQEAIKWLEVVLVLIIVLDEARQGRLHWLLVALALAGSAQALGGLWEYGGRGTGPESFRLPDGHYRAYGSFEQPNPFGGFLGLLWPIFAALTLEQVVTVWRSPRALRGWLVGAGWALPTALMLAGLYASFSRGAWLGAAAAGMLLAVFWPRRLRYGLGLGALAVVGGGIITFLGLLPASIAARFASVADFTTVIDVRGLNITDANFAIVERLAHWQAALNMIEARPWLGVGWGGYIAAYPTYSLLNWPFHLGHAHNIYLHTWAEMGVLGLLAYLSIWGLAVVVTVRVIRSATGPRRALAVGLLGVWTHLLTHQAVDNLHVNNTDLLLAVELGLLYALQDQFAPQKSA